MDETELNRVIVNSFRAVNHFAYKIPDPRKENIFTSAKRPFDLFAVTKKIYFIESKLIKNNYKAWNFNSIADHQWEAIGSISNIKSIFNHNLLESLFVLGVWIPRKEFAVFFFDFETVNKAKISGKKSFSKKDLLRLKELGYGSSIIKKRFDTYKLKIVRDNLKFY